MRPQAEPFSKHIRQHWLCCASNLITVSSLSGTLLDNKPIQSYNLAIVRTFRISYAKMPGLKYT